MLVHLCSCCRYHALVRSCRLIDRHGTVLDIRAFPFQILPLFQFELSLDQHEKLSTATYFQGRYHAGIYDDN